MVIHGVRFTAVGYRTDLDYVAYTEWMPGDWKVLDADEWRECTGLPCSVEVLDEQAWDNLDEVAHEGRNDD